MDEVKDYRRIISELRSDIEGHLDYARQSGNVEFMNSVLSAQAQLILLERKYNRHFIKGIITLVIIMFSLIFGAIETYIGIIELNGTGYFDVLKESLYLFIADSWGKLFFAILIGGSGVVLFFFKKQQQFIYGVFETVFAVVNCYIVADNIPNQNNKLIYILLSGMSTVYLTVRGISNISDGWRSFEYRDRMNRQGINELIIACSNLGKA